MGRTIGSTHELMWCGGLVACNRCGGVAHGMPIRSTAGLLFEPCKGRLATNLARNRLIVFRQGVLPKEHRKWPDELCNPSERRKVIKLHFNKRRSWVFPNQRTL